jgi:hypothetical protein
MIVITQNIVLDAVESGPDHPVIGWHNLVTAATIAASSADASYPATNVANPATYREWRAAAAVQCYLTVTTDGLTPIDYLAIARHNLGSGQIPVSVETFNGTSWDEQTSPVYLPDDAPALFRWSSAARIQARLRMQASGASVIPRVAVMYCGKLIVVERKLYVGHTPLTLARRDEFSNGVSESGEFLGRIQLSATTASPAQFRLISRSWYDEVMAPAIARYKGRPMFFGWRPASKPRQVGYAWLTNDPMPVAQGASDGNRDAFELQMGGIV